MMCEFEYQEFNEIANNNNNSSKAGLSPFGLKYSGLGLSPGFAKMGQS